MYLCINIYIYMYLYIYVATTACVYIYIYILASIGGDGDEANARARNIQDATPYPKVEKLVGTDLQPSTTVFWAALREIVDDDESPDASPNE